MATRVGVERSKQPPAGAGDDETREVLRAPSLGTTEDVVGQGPVPPEASDPIQLGRFEIVKRLGKGAMGVVYEAMDPRVRSAVAIKSVSRLSPEALYRFKQEFRSLVRLQHPNVVQLHELHFEGDRLFFTMELIHGEDFVTALCGPKISADSPNRRPCRDYPRLHDALRQLAEGVHAIHAGKILHRDIKPSNVLISNEGRVVLLDFGLVRQHDINVDLGVTDDGAVLGTPLYMSPEQALGERLGPPSDWYGVGEMLYQALTGRTPFQGKGMLALLAAKQDDTPPEPSSIVPGIPPALEALCIDLLRREPDERPNGEEVLRRIAALDIEGGASDDVPRPIDPSSSAETLYLGREVEHQALCQALEATRRGRPVVVLVDGASGMGKTAMVERFLGEIGRDENTVLLQGKCSERESIPYKALDSVMDTLCVHLRGFANPGDIEALLPRDPRAVARLFPVLLSIPAVANAPERDELGLDPTQARRRAFGALRELLGRIADRRRLVVHIDDLQWTDLDSAILLDAILRDADGPPMLLLATYRTDADGGDGPLARLVGELEDDERVDVRRIRVGPMTRTEASDLALRMLGDRSKRHRALADEVAREAEGSPFFVGELVRYAQRLAEEAEIPVSESDSSVSLDSVIRHRLRSLPEEARHLLGVIAVAGGQVSQGIALSVAMGEAPARGALSKLRAESLVRIHGPRDNDLVEIYHDRIRETALRTIERDDLAEIHLALGRALESSGDADAVALSHHFRQAGEDQRATRHTLDAAEQAEAALAFDRAAQLYRAALDLSALPAEEVPETEARLAEALANAGRLYDSAQAYLRASDGGRDREHLEWTRRAADHMLASGHSEEGRVALQTVLELVGLGLPKSTGRAIASLLRHRAALGVRGLKYRLRDASEIDPADLERLDAAWTASRGLVYTEGILGADFHARHLRMALRCGEPMRLSRALAIEAHMQAILGADKKLSKAQELLADAEQLAEQTDSASARGFVIEARGHVWMAVGHWPNAVEDLDKATSIFREQCTGMTQELSYCDGHGSLCQWFMGRVREVATRAPVLLRESTDRANPYVQGYARGLLANVMMAEDHVEDAEEQLAICRREAPRHFEAHKLNYVSGTGALRRYRGDTEGAWSVCERDYPEVKKLTVLSAALAKAEFLLWRGSCALAGATSASDPAPLLAEARSCAGKLMKIPAVFTKAYAHLMRAGVAALQGNDEAAVADLRQAIERASSRSMAIHVAAAQRRLAAIVGGSEGESLLADSDAFMQREGVVRPDRFTDMAAPGFVRR